MTDEQLQESKGVRGDMESEICTRIMYKFGCAICRNRS